MKKNPIVKKPLKLTKEQVRVLSSDKLTNVAGAAGSDGTFSGLWIC
jgi:hypothetical protein